jgi:sulfur reductase FeS subunit
MSKFAMVINLGVCVGCNACMAACSMENQTPVWDPEKFRTYVYDEEIQLGDKFIRQFFPKLCNHCDNPPCVSVCPTGATWKESNGIVRVNPETCMGCQACAMACPYDARYGADSEDIRHGEAYYGKDFLKRAVPSIDKCDFCYDRLQENLLPACVETCVGHARIFGDLDKPDDLVTKIVAAGGSHTLLPELGTRPNVYYVHKLPEGVL